MAEIRQEETQKDFFELSGSDQRAERFPSIQKTQKPILLYVSVEQILLTGILLVLAMCFVFFLGVLRGRSLAERPRPMAITVSAAVPAAVQRPTAPASKAAVIPARAVQTPVSADNPYTIQLVTYKKKSLAEGEMTRLRRLGFSPVVITKGEYFVVCAGQYANKDAAKADLRELASKYPGCFLIRR